jgi:hypothetical protein
MKPLLIFLIAFATVFSMSAQKEDANIVKETRTIKNFDKLRVSKGINVTLIKGEEPGAEINIINASPSDVLIENDLNKLTIKMKTRVYIDVTVEVYLTYTNIRQISVGSGGNVSGHDVLVAETLTLEAALDGVIDINVDVETIDASVSAARITLKGFANTVEAKATTGGKFQGQNLKTKRAFATANTGGIVSLNVTEYMDARAGTGGTVEYMGDPAKIEIKETFGGSVEKM